MAVDINKQLERAKRYLEKDKTEDAIEAYESVLNESPGQMDALQGLGDIYTRQGHPDHASSFYAQVFDRLFESRDENKALALYSRALKTVQQPPERMVRYALLLQKQNRAEEAIEQFSLASELFLAHGKDEAALDCLERVAKLDPDNAALQCSAGELAERLEKAAVAARAFLRAGQLTESAGDLPLAIELFDRAHRLTPDDRSPALFYGQAQLRAGNAAETLRALEPFASGDLDGVFLSTVGEALMRTGALDRACAMFERLSLDQPSTAAKLFELAGQYLSAKKDAEGVALLGRTQRGMVAARRESDFALQLNALVESNPASIALAEFCAKAYGELNREAKYFDALVRLFDIYLDAGNIAGACDAFEKLVDIDPYDSRNQQRIDRLEGRADPQFLVRVRARLSQVATHATEQSASAPSSPPAGGQNQRQQTLEDLMVQSEIFIQYSLQTKAVERLQKIAELFPGEEKTNERLRNLFQMANWSPAAGGNNGPGGAGDAGALSSSLSSGSPAGGSSDTTNTMRDLAKISEISQSLFRLTSPRAVLSASINEMGGYLHATRCLAVIGPPGKPPQMAAEYCAPGTEPAPPALLVRLLAHLEHAIPDPLGGLPLEAAAAPVLRELGLETALAVVLTSPETHGQAGMVIAGHARPHSWRPSETYFLQAVGDQMLLGVSHTRLRTLARNLGVADEKTGLLARSSYLDCVLSETHRAKTQGTPLSLVLVQIEHGHELLRQHGEAQLQQCLEQLARALEPLVRQTSLAVKYTSWAIAFILPDTPGAGAQLLAEKLCNTGAQVRPPWEGEPLTLNASVSEAIARIDYDSEDIVTELINRAEAGLLEAQQR